LTPFGAYARYYDLLYGDKNYQREIEFVSALIKRHAPGAKTILDLGCGTGIHACALAQQGFKVTGIDHSAGMLARARERDARRIAAGSAPAEFLKADIRDFKLNRRFDAVVALFHVVSYLPENSDLEAAFARIAEHLNPSGLLIFDHWYGPAVLTSRPEPRLKTFENTETKVIRFATPALLANDNLVDVRYDLLIEDKALGRWEQFAETHRMRYLFWPEIKSLLSRHGLRPLAFCEWLSDRAPGEQTWNAFTAAIRLECA